MSGPANPGTVVPSGSLFTPGGAAGPIGGNAWALSSGSFTVPAIGATNTITLVDASWVAVGEYVYVAGSDGSGGAGALQVTAKAGNVVTLLNPVVAPQTIDSLGGRLQYVNATTLSFTPFGGALIRINGALYTIPASGITGLGNANVYVNGVAGQNLAASTLYRVYCFNNSGVLTGDFSATGHATSSTTGNVGTEIKSGDDTRTFIGLIYTNASSQFTDAPSSRCVRSWVNRKQISFSGSVSGNTTSTAATGLGGLNLPVVCFADDVINVASSGFAYNSVSGAQNNIMNYLDSAQVGGQNSFYSGGANWTGSVGILWAQPAGTEGMHLLATVGYTSTGTMTYSIYLTGTVG